RALGCFVVTMLLSGVLMVAFGLPDTPARPYPPQARITGSQDPSLQGSFGERFTADRCKKAFDVVLDCSVFRSSSRRLTAAGRYVEKGSRIVQPALLALAVLAVRGRIKRG